MPRDMFAVEEVPGEELQRMSLYNFGIQGLAFG